MKSSALEQSLDNGDIPAAWSVACCVIAMAISYIVGNLPTTVIALFMTVVVVVMRTHAWVTNRRCSSRKAAIGSAGERRQTEETD